MQEKDLVRMSNPTLRRLPQYLREIKRLYALGESTVSCTKLSEIIGVPPISVRKDLEQAGLSGKPKTGYVIPEMITQLEASLGLDSSRSAVLVGAGNLGCALLGYQGFSACAFDIVAAFDSDSSKADRECHGKKILPMRKLENLIQRLGIKIAILTTPPEVAQEIADRLVSAGVIAIWNFSPTVIKAPEDVIVQNEHLTVSLSVLLSKVSKLLHE